MRIEWDDRKAETNLRKHGVSFDEAATVFGDSGYRLFSDPDRGEERYIAMGYSTLNRLLTVVHCYRGSDDETVRIISARRATSNERVQYEEGI